MSVLLLRADSTDLIHANILCQTEIKKNERKITSIGRGEIKPLRKQSNRTGALGSPNLASIPHTPGVIKNQTHPRPPRQSPIIHTLHKALRHQAPQNY